jgi:integrase
VTDAEFIEGFKRAKDKNEWSKVMGAKIIAFYNHMLQNGYSVNTGRNYASTARAFSRDTCAPLIVKRGKIAKAKSAKGEHEFTREELAKMFYVADVRDKAVLATAVSLGFSVEDFSELKRDFIESLVNKAITEKIDFIGFDYERSKTGVESRSHLTPEAKDSLKAWFEYTDKKRESEGKPKGEYVWSNGNGKDHLTDHALNDVVKKLTEKANIVTTGKIRFHLLRKYLMNALHDAGFTDWEVKRAVGKEIPTSDDTYLRGLSRKVSEKFPTAYEYIRLSGFANKNGLKIEQLEQKIQQMEIKAEQQNLETETMRRIIGFALPQEAVKHGIIEAAKVLPNMNAEKLEQLKLVLDSYKIMTLEDAAKVLRELEGTKETKQEQEQA